MSILIGFTGGCYAGKTTTMEMLAEELTGKGYEVIFQKENVRPYLDKVGMSIDEIRKDANKLLDMQMTIAAERKERDLAAAADKTKNRVYLIDRTFADTMFYVEEYIKKQDLSEERLAEFIAFHTDLVNTGRYLYSSNGYSIVIEFMPIKTDYNKDGADPYRPKNISLTNQYESECIGLNNRGLLLYNGDNSTMFMTVDYNDKLVTNQGVVDVICELIRRTEAVNEITHDDGNK